MQIGLVFPQIEFPPEPEAIKDYAQTAEELGYTHILAYDHVLGANPNRPGGWNGPYTYINPFYEPFMLFSYMAGFTEKLGFCTGIIILPQRQTVLVAKQASVLDVLCQGKLRLGIGLGWNQVEYEALNENFHTRGKRIEEQVEVLRLLFSEPLVDFSGKWHHISDAGLNPMPVQRPIPIWFGGHAEPVLRRAARLGDGWMPNFRDPKQAEPLIEQLHRYREEAGVSNQPFGIEARLPWGDGNPAVWRSTMEAWQDLGATHLSLNTMGVGFATPREHIDAIQRFAREAEIIP